MSEKNTQREFESVDLLFFIWKYKKPLIVVGILAVVISSVVSLLIDEKFKSYAIIIPAQASHVSFNNGEQVLGFGGETELERTLGILNSRKIRDRIIIKYNLLHHYKINAKNPYKDYILSKKYEGNIDFKRTKYGSIRITVMDTDADTASMMANDIVGLVDTIKNEIIKKRTGEALTVILTEYNDTENQITNLIDSLTKYSKMGVVDDRARAELNGGLSLALIQGKREAIDQIKDRLHITESFEGIYRTYIGKLDAEVTRLNKLEYNLKQIQSAHNSVLSHKFVIEHAYPANRKSYPIRWLIVAVSTFSSLLFTTVIILFLKKFNQLKSEHYQL